LGLTLLSQRNFYTLILAPFPDMCNLQFSTTMRAVLLLIP
jgi:hypothetical protein